MKGKKRSLLGKVDWKRTLVAFSILIVLLLLPIAVYLYTSRTIDTIAQTVVDSFQNTNFINTSRSRNYEISNESVSMKSLVFEYSAGRDGDLVVSSNMNLDDATAKCAVGGYSPSYNVLSFGTDGKSAVVSTAPGSCLSIGDEILLLNVQGTGVTTNVGNYEILKVASVSGTTVNFVNAKTKYYGSSVSSDSGLGTVCGSQKVVLQRIPQFDNVTVNAGYTLGINSWNGEKGGILVFKASGNVVVNGTIDASGDGFRGASPGNNSGEGMSTCSVAGGGPNYGGAGYGSYGGAYSTRVNTANAGLVYGFANLSKIYLGSGGSSSTLSRGCRYNYNYGGVSGGGIVFIQSQGSITVNGNIYSKGTNGHPDYTSADGKECYYFGGSGSGGSIYLLAESVSLGSSKILATGGTNHSSSSANGGDGRIAAFYNSVISGASSPSSTNSSIPVYPDSMVLESVDLISGTQTAQIQNFTYTLSSEPSGSNAFVQFSRDGSSWYSSSGELSGRDSLASGTNVISLSGLLWESSTFFYKITFESNGSVTPVLEGIVLGYQIVEPDPYLITDNYQNTNLIDLSNSSRYELSSETIRLDQIDYSSSKGNGSDGNYVVSANANIDAATGSCAAGGFAPSYSVSSFSANGTSATVSVAPGTCLKSGDEVLIINLRGGGSSVNTGNYEILKVASVSGTTVTFTSAKTKYYGSAINSDAGIAVGGCTSQIVVLQRIPQFANVTINAGVTLGVTAWNGLKGGIIAFKANGTVNINGIIDVSGKGFRGGQAGNYSGEGMSACSTSAGAVNYGGAAAGGSSAYSAFGGAYGTRVNVTGAGNTYGIADLSKIYLGSGGSSNAGGGQGCRYTYAQGAASGGGIVYVMGNDINVNGNIYSKGGNGAHWVISGNYCYGDSGSGSGGSVKLVGNNVNLGASKILATGGIDGRNKVAGSGGVGRIAAFYNSSLSGTSSPSANTSILPVYESNMILKSKDLLPDDTIANVVSFKYSLSSKPSGTGANIQFSKNGTQWYSSSGVIDSSDTLNIGTDNLISLSSLNWNTSTFYYKITFTSNGVNTPVLENIKLAYEAIPEIPTMGTAQALSTDTIRWNFTDNADNEEGFMLVDGNNNFVKYCLGENLTYCDENGLSENTQYTRKVKAYNNIGYSDVSSSANAYTMVSVPSFAVASKSASSISLVASTRVNDAEIYFDCEGDNCDDGINSWISGNNAVVTNLNSNTDYSFRVKARNGDNVESAYSQSIVEYTLAVKPGISAGPVSSDSISLNADGINNLASGQSGVYFESEQENNEGIAEWIKNETDIVIGLEPNKEYQFKVKARNYDGIQTDFSDYISVFTGADIPGGLVEKSRDIDKVKIAIVKGDNPDTTKYAILDETTGKYIDKSTNLLVENEVWGSFAQFGGEAGVNVLGLNPGMEYKFKVKAKNDVELETEYSPILSVFTKLLTPTLLSATDIQRTSVNWNVTDTNTSKVGYKIYDQAGNLLLTCSYSNMSACKETNLASNTTYSRKVKVYTNNSESDFSPVFQVTTLAQDSAIVSLTPTGHDSFALSISGNARDTIQVLEEQSNQYLNRDLNVLTSNVSSLSYSNTVNILGLKPNTRYSFKVKSINNQGVATNWSTTVSAYTFAQVPAMVKIERISNEIAKLYINNLDNPSNTDIALRETNTNKYLDFTKNILVKDPVWGKFTDFGGVKGVEVRELELGKQYGFAVQAKNLASVETSLSESLYIGASAILKNVDSMLKATLVEKTDVDLTNPDNGQYGEKAVRVLEGEYLIADIPVLFAKDRDWADVVLATSPREKKTVIKLNENHGVLKPFTMYVVGEDTNVFVLCPGATKLADIGPNCEGGVKYTGPFPQKINVEGNDVYVSVTVIGGVKYWVADGLTGTGGMGYYEETKNVEEAGVVLQVFDDIKETIDEIDKPQLQTITVATGAVSVAVGTTAALGGLSQFAYSIGQFFLSIFSALGYRRKRIHYGFVYDSQTKEPLSLAVVRIMDMDNKLVGTEVTNMNGRITGNLESGEYTIMVSKRGYKFPSENIKGSEDYPISNVYTGKLVVSSSDSNIQVAIPMDPVEMSNMDRMIVVCRTILSKFALLLNFVIFVGGILLVVYMYQKYPEKENLLIALVYILPLYTLIASLFDKNGKYGKVILKKNRKPVDGISVYIKEREFNKIIAKRVTNEKGMYRFIVDKGRYEISIDSNKYKLLNSIEDLVVDVKKDNHMITKKLRIKEV